MIPSGDIMPQPAYRGMSHNLNYAANIGGHVAFLPAYYARPVHTVPIKAQTSTQGVVQHKQMIYGNVPLESVYK